MRKEIIFTVVYKDNSIDVCTSMDILVKDLKDIIFKKFGVESEYNKFYSNNQKICLNEDQTLMEQRIWDCDILTIVR